MKSINVPALAYEVRGGEPITMVAPAGSPDDTEIASCQVLRSWIEIDGEHSTCHFLYFQPEPEDLAALNLGGSFELGILGTGFPPVTLHTLNAAGGHVEYSGPAAEVADLDEADAVLVAALATTDAPIELIQRVARRLAVTSKAGPPDDPDRDEPVTTQREGAEG